jgi:Kef-type K+ transport system membrane component KefB/mannitol/fructose-specific phosphotransferase system IIA component
LTQYLPSLPITDPVLIVAIAMIIFLVAPTIAERFKVPGLIGLIVSGAIFGPHGLGLLARDATIVLLGTVGLLYLVFLAGLELDLQRFLLFRRRSIIFGVLSFGIPMVMAAVTMPLLGFGTSATLLLGAIVGSHTLLAYPIVSRLGLVRNAAITTVVGGTLVTDVLSLSVLAVIAGSVGGNLSALFFARLLVGIGIFVAIVLWGVPKLGRWFFKSTPGRPAAEFIFLMVVLFTSAVLAGMAGMQPIIGAFMAGLTLNRLIPNEGPSMTRVRFVGSALFVPFFLLSVGMLEDPRVLAGSWPVWMIATAITTIVVVGKWMAAVITQRAFHYSRDEGWVAFGLSVPQAAATLAVTFVGLDIGLFGEDVVNAVVIMILLTGVIGPYFTERFGHAIALADERKPLEGGTTPQRILVPMANPATSDDLMDLALMIRQPVSREPIYPLTVVPADMQGAEEQVALAESMLSHAVAYAAAADTPVIPITRMDHNFATGIARAVAETRSSTIIIGWDGRRSPRRGIFGTVLDQLLDIAKQQVLVAKLGHPLNTTRRIIVLVPRGTDHLAGYLDATRVITRMASRLGARIRGFTVGTPSPSYEVGFAASSPPATFEEVPTWEDMLRVIPDEVQADDLVVVMSARRGAVSWVSTLERLPARLAELLPESFIMLYPSEAIPTTLGDDFADERRLPTALAAHRILYNLPSVHFTEALDDLLETEFGTDQLQLASMRDILLRSDGLSWELLPGVVVPHARVTRLSRPLLFLGISREGISFPDIGEPARLIFLLLTPEDRPDEHLATLTSIAALVRDTSRIERIADARGYEDLLAALEPETEPVSRSMLDD